MKRSLWLIFAALVLLAAAVLFRYQPDRLARIDQPPEQPGDPDQLADVTVREELVTAPVSTVGTYGPATDRRTRLQASATRQSLAPSSATVEPAAAVPRVPESRASRDQTLFEKARRAFVGNGRHRPEPFPRPRDN